MKARKRGFALGARVGLLVQEWMKGTRFFRKEESEKLPIVGENIIKKKGAKERKIEGRKERKRGKIRVGPSRIVKSNWLLESD